MVASGSQESTRALGAAVSIGSLMVSLALGRIYGIRTVPLRMGLRIAHPSYNRDHSHGTGGMRNRVRDLCEDTPFCTAKISAFGNYYCEHYGA